MSQLTLALACFAPAVLAAGFSEWQQRQDPDKRAIDRMAHHDRRVKR